METKGKGFGAIRGYASGGLIAGLKGMLGMKTETVSEKYARQDAEFRAKHPQPAAPASAPAKAQAQGNTAIGDYAGMTAMQKREKAAGLKAGGMVKKKCVDGGRIEGPGGPTDDLVPIMASNGEFMIKASSAKILGPELLEALNDVGGKEESKNGDKLKVGGMIRKMSEGGTVNRYHSTIDDAINAEVKPPKPGSDLSSKFGMIKAIGRDAASMFDLKEGTTGTNIAEETVKQAAPMQQPTPSIVGNAYSDPSRKLDVAPSAPPTVDDSAIASTEAQKRASGQQGVAYNLNDPSSNASILAQNPAGAVRRVGNSYSGANVSGNVGFVGADGNPISGRPGGGYVAGGAPAPVVQSLANPDGSQWSAGDNAIMAANIRDGIDKYRGTSRDARNDPMNQPMTKAKRSALVQMAQVNSQDRRYADQNVIAQGQLGVSQAQLGLNRDKLAADTGMEKIRQQLWAAYTNGTPEQKAQAAEQIRMLNGKAEPRDKYAAGQIGTGPDGTPLYGTFNTETGLPPQGQQQAKAAAPAGAISMLKANPKMAADFDAKYGAGAAKQILGQ